MIDAYSRRVVGRQLASHMRTDLVLDALRMALGQRAPGANFELVAHTDRGSRHTSADYTQELTDHGVLASVGTVGDAYDDAMAESFVDTFKTELVADPVWRSRSQLELASSNASPGSTTNACTNPSAIFHPWSSSLSTLGRGIWISPS